MAEHLKALVVIVGLAAMVFALAKPSVCHVAISEVDFKRRCILWLAITILAFVSHNFWFYVLGTMALLLVAAPRDSSRFALFLFLMFAVPAFTLRIPGFGGIQQFLSLNHSRVLVIVLLVPAYFVLRRDSRSLTFGKTAADKCLLGYIGMQIFLQASVDSFTNTMRYTLYAVIDVLLPYYVASRAVRDLQAFRDAVMSFVVASALLAVIGLFEFARHWLLYSALPSAMGVPFGLGNYMGRGDALRATASTGHSIVLGYILVVALGLFVFARRAIPNARMAVLGLAILIAGLLVTSARGPWVGGVAVLSVVVLTGPQKFSRFAKLAAFSLPLLAALSFTPFGEKIINVLPFIGTEASDSVTYRQRLFEVSVGVILQNPVFGAFDYLVNPAMQEMIQGEGIIDVVNSFLGVALTYGLLGLSLFTGVFAFAGAAVWRTMRKAPPDSEVNLLGRALLATLVGIMVTITTVSSISFIPLVYWVVAGLCVGYARVAVQESVANPPPRAARMTAFRVQG